MFTLWYAHLIYKEYRNILERFYVRRDPAIEAPGNDTNDFEDDELRYRQTPPEELSQFIPMPISIQIPDMNFSVDETSFQPLATSSPLLRSLSTDDPEATPEVALEVVSDITVSSDGDNQGNESDLNRTPSFSNMTSSSDPNLVINRQYNAQPQEISVAPQTKKQEETKKFLEAESKRGSKMLGEHSNKIVEPINKAVNNEDADDAKDEETEEEDSEMEDEEEENSVIASAPSNLRVSAGRSSSIEVINQEINEED